jgi:hypothetical protein
MVAWKRSSYSALLFFEYFLALLSREINCEQKKKKKVAEHTAKTRTSKDENKYAKKE